ncbi:MAG: ABC transporter ATP-binding protein [Planctomycetes bacterium]|nr:ABC transporter ATP-binding protein [Planctomycetota bacterium]
MPKVRPVATDSLIAARGIVKSFQIADRTLEVLHGVDLDVKRGELVALMGASGAGKSTLIQVMGLLDRPTSGKVLLDGSDAWELPLAERAALRNRAIGFVFQFYHLLPELNAVENVLLPAMIGNSWSGYKQRAKEFKDRARGMLVKFGLEQRLDHRPAQLSGGERQRVAIARALFLDPKMIIADEPTGNLDSATGERVLELLLTEQHERGVSLLLVTHDERLAAHCQRIVRMEDGRVV